MTGKTIGTSPPGAKNKRVMIAILLSLLFHAGVAGSASAVYWLQKEPPILEAAVFSLSIRATDQNEPNFAARSQQAAPVAPATEPISGPADSIDAQASTTKPLENTSSTDQSPSPPLPSVNKQQVTVSSTATTEERRGIERTGTAPSITDQTGKSPTEQPEFAEPATVRRASVIEHMLVQNLVSAPSLADSAIQLIPLERHEIEVSDLTNPAQQLPVAMQLPRQHVRLETDIDGTPVYSHASIKHKAFSAYAHFIDRWDNDVFLSSDQVIGDFHVNSRIRLADTYNSQPRIHGRMTIGVNQFLTREFQNEDAFLQGVESGVGMIPMDREPLLALMADIHQGTEIHYFKDPISLTFQADGSVAWRSLNGETQSGLIPSSELPLVMINEGRNRFELSGEINGHFLVYSPHQIVITGQLRYVDDANDDLTINSPMLGLVSRRSIEIASRSTTGSGDLRIDAAIYAARRFSVRRFDDDHQGALHIFGSLVAGSISATEPRFTTLIEKDPRLDEIRPPGFPLTGQTVLAEWGGTWLEQTSQ